MHPYSKAPSKNDSNKTCWFVHDLSMHKTYGTYSYHWALISYNYLEWRSSSFPLVVCLSATVHEFSPWSKIFNFSFQSLAMFIFLDSCKSGLTKSSSSSKDLAAHVTLMSHVHWYQLCIHLSSLKIPPSPLFKSLLNKMIIKTELPLKEASFL
jgi:hypothetical protein